MNKRHLQSSQYSSTLSTSFEGNRESLKSCNIYRLHTATLSLFTAHGSMMTSKFKQQHSLIKTEVRHRPAVMENIFHHTDTEKG